MTVVVVILSIVVALQMVAIWLLWRAASAMTERAFRHDMAVEAEAKALIEEHGMAGAKALVQGNADHYEGLKVANRDERKAEIALGFWSDEVRWRQIGAKVVEIEAEAPRNREGTWE